MTVGERVAGAGEEITLCGDTDGDGLSDLIHFKRGTAGQVGRVLVSRNQGNRTFAAPVVWNTFFCVGSEVPLVGDFNGDGRADVVTFVRSTQAGAGQGDVYVGLSTGGSFVSTKWHDFFCIGDEEPVVGDFNGDGRADVATCTRGTTADVYVALSDGVSFVGTGVKWHENFCRSQSIPLAADVDGDGRADLIAFQRESVPGEEGWVRVTYSASGLGTDAFVGDVVMHGHFCVGNELPAVGDLNADGRADVLTLDAGSRTLYAAINAGDEFRGTGEAWQSALAVPAAANARLLTGRFNGDVNDDVATTGFEAGSASTVSRVTITGAHAEPLPTATAADRAVLTNLTGFGSMGVPQQMPALEGRPAQEDRPLLCILLSGPGTFALTAAQAASLCFGPGDPNISAYFQEVSAGRFRFVPANRVAPGGTVTGTGVLGPFALTAAPADTWTTALQTANASFDFSLYDTNGDGTVTTNELCVLVIDNFTANLGANRQRTISADGKTVRLDVGAVGHMSAFQNAAHELSHCLGTIDLYNLNCAGQGATLMSCTAGNVPWEQVHLDAWHKIRLGWATPRVYDVAEAPAGAWMNLPRELRLRPDRGPVVLHDASAPARRQRYVMEYRNTDDAPGAWGGYDQDVAGTGLVTWLVETTAANELTRHEYRIDPGPNGTLQTPVSPADVLVSGSIFPGADTFLNSVPAGDDLLLGDNTCWLTTTPGTPSSRSTVEFYDDPSTPTRLNWWRRPTASVPEANLDSGVSLRSVSLGGGCYVEWGRKFTPWLDEPLHRTLQAGRSHYFGGDLGVRFRGPDGTSYAALRDAAGREWRLQSEVNEDQQWAGESAYFRVPLAVPPGRHTIRVYRDLARTGVSNAWEVTVENPYWTWLTSHWTAAEAAALGDPCTDADGDGLANGLEYMLGGNPRDATDGAQRLERAVVGDALRVRWTVPSTREGFMPLRLDVSDDLRTWTASPAATRSTVGSSVVNTVLLPLAGRPQRYARLVVECPPW